MVCFDLSMEWLDLPKDASRREAKFIKKCMQEIIDNYGYVTLADFYALSRNKAAVYTDNKKGWYTLAGSRVSLIKRKGRYRLKLPSLVDLDI